MTNRYLNVVLVASVGWWAWMGPVKDMRETSEREALAENARKMSHCLHGEAFAAGSGAEREGDPEQRCASRHGLYRYQGQWWSYDQTRQVRTRRSAS